MNGIDPSGNYTLMQVSVGMAGLAIVAGTAQYGSQIGLSLLTGATSGYENGITKDRRWSIWDVIAANIMMSSISNFTQEILRTNIRARRPDDGHHTIPIYLCGSPNQRLSYIDRRKHVEIHRGLSVIEISLKNAEDMADRMIPFTRRSTGPIRSLAETKDGRSVISNAIQTYYLENEWWGQGLPSIGVVFPQERREFVSGKTSLPSCKRGS